MNTEIHVSGGASLKGKYYSQIYFTDMTQKLNELFGFNYPQVFLNDYERMDKNLTALEPEIFLHYPDISRVLSCPDKGLSGEITIPISKEVKRNIISARSMMVAYNESERVVDYFSNLATKIGSFFALSYDEVVKSNLHSKIIQVAIEEGYARKAVTNQSFNGQPLALIELTDKFCPLEKLVMKKQLVQ